MRAVETLLEPARGFFELGMHVDAWTALDDLQPEQKGELEVVALRLDILMALNRFEDAVALGTGACRQFPSINAFFLKTASALMDLTDHGKAFLLLRAGPSSLQMNAAYWYALARCNGRLGHVAQGKECLSKCFNLDKTYRSLALDDPI